MGRRTRATGLLVGLVVFFNDGVGVVAVFRGVVFLYDDCLGRKVPVPGAF